MKKTRSVLLSMQLYEYKVLEDYLSLMANKGWIFKGFGKYGKNILKFVKEEPMSIQYRVDYVDGAWKTKESEELLAYRTFVEQYGYEFIAGNLQFDVYQQLSEQYPIRENTKEDQIYLRKAVVHGLYVPLLLVLVGLMQVFTNYQKMIVMDFSENVSIMMLCSWGFLTICYAITCFRIIAWLCHIRHQPTLRNVLFYSTCDNALVCLVISSFLLFVSIKATLAFLFVVCSVMLYRSLLFANLEHSLKQSKVWLNLGLWALCCVLLGAGIVSSKEYVSKERHEVISFGSNESVAIIYRESLFAIQGYYSVNGQTYEVNVIKPSILQERIASRIREENQITSTTGTVVTQKKELRDGVGKTKTVYDVSVASDTFLLSSRYQQQPTPLQEETLQEMVPQLDAYFLR